MPRLPLRVLIAPLDWGLGHATRSLALAHGLETAFAAANSQRELLLHWASNGGALALLRAERPNDRFHALPSYGVRYPTRSATFNMLIGAPRMALAVQAERRAAADLHEQFGFDLVISDNRYGVRLPGVLSLFVCHQVFLPVPGFHGRVANAVHHALLRGFDELAVPDRPGAGALAGSMSRALPRMPTEYLGVLSRFGPSDPLGNEVQEKSNPAYACDLLIVLSGPEPARTRFEALLLRELRRLPARDSWKVTLVRGLARASNQLDAAAVRSFRESGHQLQVHDYLRSAELEPLLRSAGAIVCRSGYSTVMDLAVIGRKAIYVPTPGQPEQEQLGLHLAKAGKGICVQQAKLELPVQLAQLQQVREPSSSPDRERLHEWARGIVARIE